MNLSHLLKGYTDTNDFFYVNESSTFPASYCAIYLNIVVYGQTGSPSHEHQFLPGRCMRDGDTVFPIETCSFALSHHDFFRRFSTTRVLFLFELRTRDQQKKTCATTQTTHGTRAYKSPIKEKLLVQQTQPQYLSWVNQQLQIQLAANLVFVRWDADSL